MRRLLPLAFLLLTGAGPTTGTVKWFCESFETVGCAPEKEARARQQCIELINSGLSQKRLKYNHDAAKRCADAQRAYAGDPLRSRARHDAVRAACSTVVEGLLGDGQACESALDCKSGLACVGTKGGPPGKCTTRLTAGSACDDEMLGGSRFYAAASEARPTCAAGTHCSTGTGELACVKDLGDGKACKGADLADCGPGLRCIRGSCRTETLLPSGQACDRDAECAIGLTCAKGKCGGHASDCARK